MALVCSDNLALTWIIGIRGLRFKPSIKNLSLQPHFLSKMHTSYAASEGHSTAGYKHYKHTLIYWLKWNKNDGNEGQTDTVQQDSILFAAPLLWAPVMNVNARKIILLYDEFFNCEDLVSLCKIYGTTLRNTTTMCTSRRWHYNEQSWERKHRSASLPLGRTGTILEHIMQFSSYWQIVFRHFL